MSNKKSYMKKKKIILLMSAIVIELASVIMIIKTYITHSSPTSGLIFLAIGLVFLVIAITKKSEKGKSELI